MPIMIEYAIFSAELHWQKIPQPGCEKRQRIEYSNYKLLLWPTVGGATSTYNV